MLRTIIISLWACGVTAGTLFLGLNDPAESHPDKTQEPQVEIKPTFSQPLIVFVPVVSKGAVTGYLFSNMSVLADTKILEELHLPLHMLIQDSYLTYLAGNEEFALPHVSKFDAQKLKLGVKDQLNKTVGKDLVEVIYMSDINFLKVQQVRNSEGLKAIQLHEEAHKEADQKKSDAASGH